MSEIQTKAWALIQTRAELWGWSHGRSKLSSCPTRKASRTFQAERKCYLSMLQSAAAAGYWDLIKNYVEILKRIPSRRDWRSA